MLGTAKLILVVSAVLLLGADGPGAAKPPADAPKDAAKPPMTREEALRGLQDANFTVKRAWPGPGVELRTSDPGPRGRKAMVLLPLVPDVVVLQLSLRQATDDDLVSLQSMSNLKKLSLSGKGIKGDGLKFLKGLSKLQNLNLAGTAVGDDGLKHIAGLAAIEVLSLPPTATNRGLATLKSLKHLRQLSLSSGITDVGLGQLRDLKGLEDIGPLTWVTDEGMADLGRFDVVEDGHSRPEQGPRHRRGNRAPRGTRRHGAARPSGGECDGRGHRPVDEASHAHVSSCDRPRHHRRGPGTDRKAAAASGLFTLMTPGSRTLACPNSRPYPNCATSV